MWPALIVNLKQHLLGKKVVEYVQRTEEMATKYQRRIIVCPGAVELSSALSLKRKFVSLFAQAYDLAKEGENKTGRISPSSLVQAGVEGSLINHYERRIYGERAGAEGRLRNSPEDFKKLIELIKLGDNVGLKLVVCADTAETVGKIAQEVTRLGLSGISLAVEWDEYIGTKTSMVESQPREIEKAVKVVSKINKKIPVYCGAGVQGEEIAEAIKQFGVQGALIATYCTKAPDFKGDYSKALDLILKSLIK